MHNNNSTANDDNEKTANLPALHKLPNTLMQSAPGRLKIVNYNVLLHDDIELPQRPETMLLTPYYTHGKERDVFHLNIANESVNNELHESANLSKYIDVPESMQYVVEKDQQLRKANRKRRTRSKMRRVIPNGNPSEDNVKKDICQSEASNENVWSTSDWLNKVPHIVIGRHTLLPPAYRIAFPFISRTHIKIVFVSNSKIHHYLIHHHERVSRNLYFTTEPHTSSKYEQEEEEKKEEEEEKNTIHKTPLSFTSPYYLLINYSENALYVNATALPLNRSIVLCEGDVISFLENACETQVKCNAHLHEVFNDDHCHNYCLYTTDDKRNSVSSDIECNERSNHNNNNTHNTKVISTVIEHSKQIILENSEPEFASNIKMEEPAPWSAAERGLLEREYVDVDNDISDDNESIISKSLTDFNNSSMSFGNDVSIAERLQIRRTLPNCLHVTPSAEYLLDWLKHSIQLECCCRHQCHHEETEQNRKEVKFTKTQNALLFNLMLASSALIIIIINNVIEMLRKALQLESSLSSSLQSSLSLSSSLQSREHTKECPQNTNLYNDSSKTITCANDETQSISPIQGVLDINRNAMVAALSLLCLLREEVQKIDLVQHSEQLIANGNANNNVKEKIVETISGTLENLLDGTQINHEHSVILQNIVNLVALVRTQSHEEQVQYKSSEEMLNWSACFMTLSCAQLPVFMFTWPEEQEAQIKNNNLVQSNTTKQDQIRQYAVNPKELSWQTEQRQNLLDRICQKLRKEDYNDNVADDFQAISANPFIPLSLSHHKLNEMPSASSTFKNSEDTLALSEIPHKRTNHITHTRSTATNKTKLKSEEEEYYYYYYEEEQEEQKDNQESEHVEHAKRQRENRKGLLLPSNNAIHASNNVKHFEQVHTASKLAMPNETREGRRRHSNCVYTEEMYNKLNYMPYEEQKSDKKTVSDSISTTMINNTDDNLNATTIINSSNTAEINEEFWIDETTDALFRRKRRRKRSLTIKRRAKKR